MHVLKLQLRLLTPLFMYGADGKTPELRPSEFKGMMRWWWRAIKAEENIEKLKSEEAKIFGGTGKGEGKSKLSVHIRYTHYPNNTFKYQPLPHHSPTNCTLCKGRCRKSFTLSAFRPDTNFEAIISFQNIIDINIKEIIFLTFILGGFGRRSRRGFGSIIIENLNIDCISICDMLNKIENSYEIVEENKIEQKKQVRVAYPYVKEIYIGRQFQTYDEVLKAIGLSAHRHSDPALGLSNPRMSSPVYVSVIRNELGYAPIITLLNSAFPQQYPHFNINKQYEFIRELL